MKESDCVHAYECGLSERCRGCKDYVCGNPAQPDVAHKRFELLPPANEPPNDPLATYYCDDCSEPDYVDTYKGGDIRAFYRDTERDLLVCEVCMRKAQANPASAGEGEG